MIGLIRVVGSAYSSGQEKQTERSREMNLFNAIINTFFFLAFLVLGIGLGHYIGMGMESSDLIDHRWGDIMVFVVAPVVMFTFWKPVGRKAQAE